MYYCTVFYQEVIWETTPTVSKRPVIRESVPHFVINRRHGFHVALSPLSTQVLSLKFDQLQDVDLHHSVLHL